MNDNDKKEDDDDRYSYQQNEEDDQEYEENDNQSINDIRRSIDPEFESYLFWTKEECHEELKKDKTNIKAHFRLGMIYLEDYDLVKARDHFKNHWLKIDHTFRKGEIYERIGDTHLKDEDSDTNEAISYYKQAIKLDPNNSMFFLKLGKCYERDREFEMAIDNYKKSWNLDNERNALPLFRLGWAYVRVKNYEKGIDTMKKAILLEPDNPEVLSKIGELLLRDDDKLDEAEGYLK